MTEAGGERWASPTTLLGMLQRGRGAAYSRALTDAERAGDLVVDCIVNDPRWDHQVEERGWLYTALVAELDVDLARLRDAFVCPPNWGGDDKAWLATEVFELVARHGVAGGVSELRRYLRSGRDFEQALFHLLPLADHPEAEGLIDDILEVADLDQLGDILTDLTAAPWPEWQRASPRIDKAVVNALSRRATGKEAASPSRDAEVRRSRADWTQDLLIQARANAPPGTPASQLVVLGDESGEETLLEIASDLLEDESLRVGVRAAVRRSLWALRSPNALAWARVTSSLDDEGGLAAVHLLAELAEESDVPRLRELLGAALACDNDYLYAQCSLVDGLGRLDDHESLGLIEVVFDETVYSYLRRRCAQVLSQKSPQFAIERAVECLNDCESETRSIAVNSVDTAVPGVRERLVQMVDDPTEPTSCQRGAALRLGNSCSAPR
jgi:hypothetical protein